MLQRVTLARATLHEPDILLFDEPYTGLDQDATALLDTLLLEEAHKGRTILMITHDETSGLKHCHQIAILNRGKIALQLDREKTTSGQFLDLYADSTSKRRRKND
jgi:heme exporter protein A